MTTMQGKVCLITGGTNGIGKVTAQALAGMGATVIIVGRSAAKTAGVADEIRAASGNQNIDFLLADLSSQQEIRRLASEFKARYSELHVLVNNAGALFLSRQSTVDGFEMTFALNHLAYFLLTNLLIDTIKASAPARIINVSSGAHRGGKIDFSNLQSERSFSAFGAYSNSKLANILFTIERARRLEGTGVTVNALHPGFVNTGFGRQGSNTLTNILLQVYGLIVPLIARTPEKGAETSIYLASSPDVQGVSGKYFFDCKAIAPAPQATDMAVARRLWDVSADMVHLAEPASANA